MRQELSELHDEPDGIDNEHYVTLSSDVENRSIESILDTELEFDIRKLESLGLSSQEERVPWIFFATFSNQLQQLAKHVLREDYIFFFYESANIDVAHTIEEVSFTKKQDLNVETVEQFTNGLIDFVVHYDLPDTSDFYIRRIGRT
ncbi:unnamed protein product, partial [Rotaria sp. Silwood1]